MSSKQSADPEKGGMETVFLKDIQAPPLPAHATDATCVARVVDSGTTSHATLIVSIPVSEKKLTTIVKTPPKRASRAIRFQLWFNTYRKFFVFVTTLNGVGLVLAACGIWNYPRRYGGAVILGNLLMAILMRNELFGRFLYLVVNTCFAHWTPLWFRLGCTSALQHLGGIHSGCAISGFSWLLFRVTLIIMDYKNNHDAVLVTGIITNVLVSISILSAAPWVRNTHHNVFERHHRFVGWLGLVATWIFVILGDSYDLETHSWNPDDIRIFRQQDFWYALGMTVFVITPWATVRQVPVDVEIPSPKVVILRFKRGMQQGLLARISRGTIMEYHAFGIISMGKDAEHHYLIAGVQGDFTRSLVENPPTALWTRELKFAGVSNTSRLYRRGDKSVHRYGTRGSFVDLSTEPTLGFNMDRLRPRKNVWANDL